MSSAGQQQYQELLGVKPGASLEEINAAYYMQLEGFSDNPTEEEAERQLRVQHAYAVLRRASLSGSRPVRNPLALPRPGRKTLIRSLVFAVLLAAPALMFMNFSNLRMTFTHYDPGTVLQLNGHSTPYGTVVRYEPEHRFHTGEPTPAYEIRLAPDGKVVWVSARVAVKGMSPVAR